MVLSHLLRSRLPYSSPLLDGRESAQNLLSAEVLLVMVNTNQQQHTNQQHQAGTGFRASLLACSLDLTTPLRIPIASIL